MPMSQFHFSLNLLTMTIFQDKHLIVNLCLKHIFIDYYRLMANIPQKCGMATRKTTSTANMM